MRDEFERNGMKAAGNGAVTGLPAVVDLNTPLDIPQFEAIRVGLASAFTKKTQELAESRKQLEQMQQQAFLTQKQAEQTMAQFSEQNAAQATAPAATVRPSLAEELEVQTGTELDAGTRNLLGLMEARFGGNSDQLGERLDTLTQQVSQVINAVSQNQNLMRTVAERPEIDAVVSRFGREALQPHMGNVAELMKANPNMKFENAVAAVAPELIAETARKETMAGLQKQADQQQQQISEVMGGLMGMEREPAGDTSGKKPFDPNESFMDSAREEMGDGAFRQFVQQDALQAAGLSPVSPQGQAFQEGVSPADIAAAFPQV